MLGLELTHNGKVPLQVAHPNPAKRLRGDVASPRHGSLKVAGDLCPCDSVEEHLGWGQS